MTLKMKIKDCPFCKRKMGSHMGGSAMRWVAIECWCGARGPLSQTWDEALVRWNKGVQGDGGSTDLGCRDCVNFEEPNICCLVLKSGVCADFSFAGAFPHPQAKRKDIADGVKKLWACFDSAAGD